MRKVIVSEFMTLDGLMADPANEMKWVLDTFNEEMGREIADQQHIVDTMLFGRMTYEIMASYWPTAAAKKEDPAVTAYMNNTAKIVFSKTLAKTIWDHSTLYNEIVPAKVRQLKQQPGKNMAIIGSASIARKFIELGLVDEYRLLVHPVVLGKGKPLFRSVSAVQKLTLTRSEAFRNGVVCLYYQSQ